MPKSEGGGCDKVRASETRGWLPTPLQGSVLAQQATGRDWEWWPASGIFQLGGRVCGLGKDCGGSRRGVVPAAPPGRAGGRAKSFPTAE